MPKKTVTYKDNLADCTTKSENFENKKEEKSVNDENGSVEKSNQEKNEKSARDVINEILNPPLKEFDSKKLYEVPKAVQAGDVNALQDLDERKLIELKEVSVIF